MVVAHKDSVQTVKIVAERLKRASRAEWEHRWEVYWLLGKCETYW